MTKLMLTSLFLSLTFLFAFSANTLLAFSYVEFSKKDAHQNFSFLLTPEEFKSIENATESESVWWPIHHPHNKCDDSMQTFLDNRQIDYSIKRFQKEWEKNHNILWELTETVWKRIPSGHDLPRTVFQLLMWENGYNGAISNVERHSPGMVILTHYEIPLDVIKTDIAPEADQDILKLLIIEKEGQKFVRWPIHPEDSKYHLEFERKLKEKQIPIVKNDYFHAYLTASRSLIVMDPETKKIWSLKTSTNHTGGLWRKKPMDLEQLQDARITSDAISSFEDAKKNPSLKLTFFKALPETISFYYAPAKMGFSIREYSDLTSGQKYYLPVFSALHEEMGLELAQKNGSSDPFAYWNEHLNLPMARAFAELLTYFGLTYDSPHSQNFLVELDQEMKPTGKMIFRDLGDTYALNKATSEMLLTHLASSAIYKYIRLGYAPFYVIGAPSWIYNRRDEWRKNFFNEFEKTFTLLSGVSMDDLRRKYPRAKYYVQEYGTKGDSFLDFFNIASCFHLEATTKDGEKPCGPILEDTASKIKATFGQDDLSKISPPILH